MGSKDALRYASSFALLVSLAAACGGKLAPLSLDAGEPGAHARDSGVDSGSAIADDSSVIVLPADPDASQDATVDAPPSETDASQGCFPPGLSCALASECCSNICENNTCGVKAMTCEGDGQACTFSAECCSDTCANGVCVAGPPACGALGAACSDPGNNCCSSNCVNGSCAIGVASCEPGSVNGITVCPDCLAQSCCPELSPCLADMTCNSFYECSVVCTSGARTARLQCIQQCMNANPSPLAAPLETCAAESCAGECE